ncbi:hypothetical protein D3C86_1200600 [compost metagenome]
MSRLEDPLVRQHVHLPEARDRKAMVQRRAARVGSQVLEQGMGQVELAQGQRPDAEARREVEARCRASVIEGPARHSDEGLERRDPALIEQFGVEALHERDQHVGTKIVAQSQLDQITGMGGRLWDCGQIDGGGAEGVSRAELGEGDAPIHLLGNGEHLGHGLCGRLDFASAPMQNPAVVSP